MRTILVGYRVRDLERSLGFYTALGYRPLAQIEPGDGVRLVPLQLPDDPFATVELVHRAGDDPVGPADGFHHLAVQGDDLAATLERLERAGLHPAAMQSPGGPDGPTTSWLTDPDGYRIELVEWPAGHAPGLTAADFGWGLAARSRSRAHGAHLPTRRTPRHPRALHTIGPAGRGAPGGRRGRRDRACSARRDTERGRTCRITTVGRSTAPPGQRITAPVRRGLMSREPTTTYPSPVTPAGGVGR